MPNDGTSGRGVVVGEGDAVAVAAVEFSSSNPFCDSRCWAAAMRAAAYSGVDTAEEEEGKEVMGAIEGSAAAAAAAALLIISAAALWSARRRHAATSSR